MTRKVAVIGSGSWGTGVTRLLSPHAEEVLVWSHEPEVARGINEERRNPRQLTDFEVAPNVRATCDMQAATAGAEALLLAVPSPFLRATCAKLAPYVRPDLPLLILTKGVEHGTGSLMADVVADELGGPERIAVLSGPNHAEEVSKGTISAAVIASCNRQVAEYFRDLLVCPAFRVYVSADVRGIEVCGAEKNVIAIACGIAAELGAGDNTLAVLMTRGLAEVTRVAVSMGADPLTCMGLAGMGDLIATCTSRHSRNRTFGEELARGVSLEEYQARTGMVVEGAQATRSIIEVADKNGVEIPITRAVNAILFEDVPVAEAIDGLLLRRSKEEFYGFTS
ncbi:MAG: NAD(P)-dependent glycerol-3-phosphate dehydrogenase [Atopobiaceae bacterium]|nr:NAD(P)-dependent glycerol-3-phosphate dehydrogenase [Atopobiaceae bacterium]